MHDVRLKAYDTQIKTVSGEKDAEGAEDEGIIEAYVSVFDNEDSYGDVVLPGAFAESLKAWEDRGDNIPFIWSHDWTDPSSFVGTILKAEETDRGLKVTAQITKEDRETNPRAAQVYRLLKSRRVNQFSFAYDILEGGSAKRGEKDVYELKKLHILEAGPCLVGVNTETELLAAKSRLIDHYAKASTKADGEGPAEGEADDVHLSRADAEALRGALAALAEVVGDILGSESTDSEDTGSEADEDEAPTGGTDPAKASGAASSIGETASGEKATAPNPGDLYRQVTTMMEE